VVDSRYKFVTDRRLSHLMNKDNLTSEGVSLAALQAGDRVEFARFVESHSPAIYRLAMRMLNDDQDAEDVLQETFIKSFQHIGNFDGRSKLSTWLYRIATNEALMLIRRRKPGVISVDQPAVNDDGPGEPLQIVDWASLPEDELLSNETRAYLDHAIQLLPDSLRVVFLLREFEGLSTLETSQALNISEGAVKTRLSRARLQLRESLSAYYGEVLKGQIYGTP
jgi:RNA polymerase sigma-70 factor, ECF subfamily